MHWENVCLMSWFEWLNRDVTLHPTIEIAGDNSRLNHETNYNILQRRKKLSKESTIGNQFVCSLIINWWKKGKKTVFSWKCKNIPFRHINTMKFPWAIVYRFVIFIIDQERKMRSMRLSRIFRIVSWIMQLKWIICELMKSNRKLTVILYLQ